MGGGGEEKKQFWMAGKCRCKQVVFSPAIPVHTLICMTWPNISRIPGIFVDQNRRWTDLKALKLCKVRSGNRDIFEKVKKELIKLERGRGFDDEEAIFQSNHQFVSAELFR